MAHPAASNGYVRATAPNSVNENSNLNTIYFKQNLTNKKWN